MLNFVPGVSPIWAFSDVKCSISVLASYVLFNTPVTLNSSAFGCYKSIFKSVLLSWFGPTSSSRCCCSSLGSSCSCSLSVWFASSSSVVSYAVAISIVWVLVISSSFSKIDVVSFGGSGPKVCCNCVYPASSINS